MYTFLMYQIFKSIYTKLYLFFEFQYNQNLNIK